MAEDPKKLTRAHKIALGIISAACCCLIGISAFALAAPDALNQSNSTENESSTPSSSGNKASSSNNASTNKQTGNGSSPGTTASSTASSTVTVSVSVSSSAADGRVSGSAHPTFKKGATAYDALCATGLSVSTKSSQYGLYVSAIGGLAEFEYGGKSGWMYSVNGSAPNVSCGKYVLKDGDTVSWYYVK